MLFQPPAFATSFARKDYGGREMDILTFMIEMHVPGVNMDFGSAAGLAAGMMAISRP